ncbi:hypothetical protein [Azospirillum sp. sgz302134]
MSVGVPLFLFLCFSFSEKAGKGAALYLERNLAAIKNAGKADFFNAIKKQGRERAAPFGVGKCPVPSRA